MTNKKQRYAVSYGEFENEKKKNKIFLKFLAGIQSPHFLIISAHDLNFHGKYGWRDQIKIIF